MVDYDHAFHPTILTVVYGFDQVNVVVQEDRRFVSLLLLKDRCLLQDCLFDHT